MGQIGTLLKQEMPREKLINLGPNSLTDVELLAIILRTGTKEKNVLELSREILTKFDTNIISRTSYQELLKFKGIKTAKATIIISLFELSRRLKLENEQTNQKPKFTNSNQIYQYIKNDYLHQQKEKVMIIYLNTKNEPTKKEFLFSGGLNQSTIDIKLILKNALENNANSIIMAHNHPSGDSTESTQDIEITNKLNKACEILQIKLLDHIILGNNSNKYTSLFDKSLL